MNKDVFGSNIDSDATMPTPKMEPALIDTPPEAPKLAVSKLGPRVRIVLDDNDEVPPTGQFFGADGVGYMLRSGEAANVPPEIINILNTAVWDAPIVDPQTKQITGYRKRLRFPYRILSAGVEA
jgi:hypothetical protein